MGECERLAAVERNAETYAASLLRFHDGADVEQRASRRSGRGTDHGRETTRVEIGLRVPW